MTLTQAIRVLLAAFWVTLPIDRLMYNDSIRHRLGIYFHNSYHKNGVIWTPKIYFPQKR